MRSIAMKAGLAMLSICLFWGGSVTPTDAAHRNRELQRVVAKGMYSPDEGAGVQSAFSAAVKAGLRERDALDLVEASVEAELEAAQIQRLLSIATQLQLEDLPVEGFIAKVEEGSSKLAAPARIVQAAERRALMFNKANLIIKSLILNGYDVDDRDELLPDLAAALEAGRAPEEAESIIVEALKAGEDPGEIRRKLFP